MFKTFVPKSGAQLMMEKAGEAMGFDIGSLGTAVKDLQEKAPAIIHDVRTRIEKVERETHENNVMLRALYQKTFGVSAETIFNQTVQIGSEVIPFG